MEPQIRYVRTSDGINLAYFTLGTGPALVQMPGPLEHVLLHARTFGDGWCRSVSQVMQLVRYDGRGFGLSTRDVTEFSLETAVRDLETVVDALRLESFVLMASSSLGPPAIRYAVDHPHRVSHLILMDTAASMRDLWSRRVQSLHPMLTAAPDLYFQTLADFVYGRGTAEAGEFAEYLSQTCEPRVGRRCLDAAFAFDATDLLAKVKAPALVVHGTAPMMPVEAATSLAAGIPGAELAMISLPSPKDLPDQLWREIRRFLAAAGIIQPDGGGKPHPAAAGVINRDASNDGGSRAGVTTILFTDIVGHTEMMQRLGDVRGRDVLREHERITRDLLKKHGGAEVKTMGDGFMASFGSVTSAMECAVSLQREFAGRGAKMAGGGWTMDEPIAIRIGLNAGEPIEEDGDLFGATVILASRIAAKAGAGEILVPDTVRGLLSGKQFLFADRGEFVPKGFDDAVRLFEVRWRE